MTTTLSESRYLDREEHRDLILAAIQKKYPGLRVTFSGETFAGGSTGVFTYVDGPVDTIRMTSIVSLSGINKLVIPDAPTEGVAETDAIVADSCRLVGRL